MSETTFFSFFYSLFLHIFLVKSETIGFKFYERFELIPKFCKVEFVCFNGEPNWMGEIFLYAASFIIVWMLFNIFYLINHVRRAY